MVRIVRGSVTQEHEGVVRPMFNKLRGDRHGVSRSLSRWGFGAEPTPKIRRAVQRFGEDLADEDSGTKRVAFGHIFHPDTLHQVHRDVISRLRLSPEGLVETMSNPSNKAWLKRIMAHEKVVAGMNIAAKRFTFFPFHSKNASAVFLYAMQGRKGVPIWRSTTSREDVASGILAAVEDRLQQGDLPPALSQQEQGEEHDEQTDTPTPPQPPGQPPATTPSLSELMSDELPARENKLARLVYKGIERHAPSHKFYQASSASRQLHASHELVNAAAIYFAHLTAEAIDPVHDLPMFTNHAANTPDIDDFHKGVKEIITTTGRRKEKDAKLMKEYLLPDNELFDIDGTKVERNEIAVDNWKTLHTKTLGDNLIPITETQKQGVAAFLVSKLAKHASAEQAPEHLLNYIRLVHQGRQTARDATFNAIYRPRQEELDPEERLNIFANMMRHGRTHGVPPATG